MDSQMYHIDTLRLFFLTSLSLFHLPSFWSWTPGGWEMEQIDGEEVDGDEDGREGKS